MTSPSQGALHGELGLPSSSDRLSPLPLHSHEQFPPLVSTTPAAPARDAARTEPPPAPQRTSMVAPGARSEDSERDTCDSVSRRLYNLQFPTVEERSDDASGGSEPPAGFSSMSRDTREMWDESRTSKAYQRLYAEGGERAQLHRDSGSGPGGGNSNLKFFSNFFDDEPDIRQPQQQQTYAPVQRRQQHMWDKPYQQQNNGPGPRLGPKGFTKWGRTAV